MKTFPKTFFALLIVFCATTALAGYCIQYFFGYGVYYPYAPDTTSTISRTTGLLATNGSHRTLIQLIWTGENHIKDGFDPFNAAGGYMGGDDVVIDSRIIEAGVDRVDEWGYTPTPPPPYVTTNSLLTPVYVRVHQDDLPSFNGYSSWYYDAPLFYPTDRDVSAPGDILAEVIHIETGNETVPTAGLVLDLYIVPLTGPPLGWYPDPPADPEIRFINFNPDTAGLSYPIPYSYSFSAIYGADTVLPGGGWDWELLTEGPDYTVTNGVVTLVTAGAGLPRFRIVRLGLIHNF